MTTQSTSSLRTAIFLQDACYQHRFIRSNNLSTIVERPERLRALKLGISAAVARLEELKSVRLSPQSQTVTQPVSGDDLAAALEKLELLTTVTIDVVDIVKSSASVNLLDHPAVKFVHGDVEGDVYLEKLIRLVKDSTDKIGKGESEIPEGLSQGDLYLCPGSLDAIQGALGTVCEAVDAVLSNSKTELLGETSIRMPTNAFVAVRPPGHHCGEDTPAGFCFVNNVAVGAAHAHLKHGVTKAIIFDIDLHHGNGTQSIAWQINEETYRRVLEEEESAESAKPKPGLMVYYGSMHDILSYPCEDGSPTLVQAASTSIHGKHGQHIENVHLEPYASDDDFWDRLYPQRYKAILERAESFAKGTDPNEVLVFISCGFDACEHEYASMSRHGHKVPASFYHRFAKDAQSFADKYAAGKLVSILEGGYSDRALISGGMAHISGLVKLEQPVTPIDERWWSLEHLNTLEKATKKRRGGKVSLNGTTERDKWLERTLAIFGVIETSITPSSQQKLPVPPSSMTLRERKTPIPSVVASQRSSPQPRRTKAKNSSEQPQAGAIDDILKGLSSMELGATVAPSVLDNDTSVAPGGAVTADVVPKRLPRVVLRVKEPVMKQEDASNEFMTHDLLSSGAL